MDSDGKAATVLADAAIREANPEVLVIVSGLSRSYDLRGMQDLQNYRSKYVFTTHVYPSSWWFTDVNWVLILGLSLLFIAGNLSFMFWLSSCQQPPRLVCSLDSPYQGLQPSASRRGGLCGALSRLLEGFPPHELVEGSSSGGLGWPLPRSSRSLGRPWNLPARGCI